MFFMAQAGAKAWRIALAEGRWKDAEQLGYAIIRDVDKKHL
jgi:hypothetical protein